MNAARQRRPGFGLLLLAVLTAPTAAPAAGVVGDGTLESCTEAALDAALSGGGEVRFACGGAATIRVSAPKVIVADTRLDGGNATTLSGGGFVQVLRVAPGVRLDVVAAVVADGHSALEPGGGIRNLGSLRLEGATLRNNVSRGFGGALSNEGNCEARDSLFADNVASIAGGAVANFGHMTLQRSTMMRNVATGLFDGIETRLAGYGAAIANLGDLRLANATVAGNVAIGGFSFAAGGAGLWSNGSVEIRNCTFARNRTVTPSPFGGYVDDGACPELDNLGVLSARNSIISGCCNTYGEAGNQITGDSAHNFIAAPGTLDICGPGFTPVRDEALRLGALLFREGDTLPTIAPAAGSAAIGAGDPFTCADPDGTAGIDQRGVARFGAGDPACDIGAVESAHTTVPPPPAPPLFLRLRGERGSWVADGRDVRVTSDQGHFVRRHADGRVLVQAFADDVSSNWTLRLAAPPGGALEPGYYAMPGDGPGEPLVDVSGDGKGCLYGSGRFVVHESLFGLDGAVERLAADFEWHCEKRSPGVRGTVRIGSMLPGSLCRADCGVTGRVDVADLVAAVAITLGQAPPSACPFLDRDGDGEVVIGDLLGAVTEALSGC